MLMAETFRTDSESLVLGKSGAWLLIIFKASQAILKQSQGWALCSGPCWHQLPKVFLRGHWFPAAENPKLASIRCHLPIISSVALFSPQWTVSSLRTGLCHCIFISMSCAPWSSITVSLMKTWRSQAKWSRQLAPIPMPWCWPLETLHHQLYVGCALCITMNSKLLPPRLPWRALYDCSPPHFHCSAASSIRVGKLTTVGGFPICYSWGLSPQNVLPSHSKPALRLSQEHGTLNAGRSGT